MFFSSLSVRASLATTIISLLVAPNVARAQDTTNAPRRDSVRVDSAARLRAVTIVGTPAERSEPLNASRIDASTIRLTPAISPYDLLRQTSGVEVHQQGQGPGFASDASLRGFSSDHSTDLALWVDGVPINEAMNGHAEDTTTGLCCSPAGFRTSMFFMGRPARFLGISRLPVW